MSISQRTKSLFARANALDSSLVQLDVLNSPTAGLSIPRFSEHLEQYGSDGLTPMPVEVLQVNVGKKCNQACAHCHVDAGPDRREVMSREIMERCLHVLQQEAIHTVDITGGAPELHPDFLWFVEQCSILGKQIIDRCNLTILVSHEKFADMPAFFAKHRVEVIASLPYFTRVRTDNQRGEGVFNDSIEALKRLNEVGYGMPDTGLSLNLVYNPTGAFLPSGQRQLEQEFKTQLLRRYGIAFNNLYAITNLPISRFLEFLLESGNYSQYMTSLLENFNAATLDGLMCRKTISVGWDGTLYDCDFNQMLDLAVEVPCRHISQWNSAQLNTRRIVTNQHCYGCTAGNGSSCGGSIQK